MVQLSQSPFAFNQMSGIAAFTWPLLKCTGGAGCGCTEWGGEEWDHCSLPNHPQPDCANYHGKLGILSHLWAFKGFCRSDIMRSIPQVCLKDDIAGRIANQDLVTIKWYWEGASWLKRGCKGASSPQCLRLVRSGRARSYRLWELENLAVPTNVWMSACCKPWSKLYDIFLSKAKGVCSKLM